MSKAVFTGPQITDYDAEIDKLKRQQSYVDELRKGWEAPQSKMVGKQLVTPSWFDELAPALTQVYGGYKQAQQDQAQQALNKRMTTDADAWMAARPQATQQELMGPAT